MFWMRRKHESEPDLIVEVQPAPLINRERLTPYVDTARIRVDTARDRVVPYVDTARERVTPLVDTARVRVTPLVEQARERVDDARHLATPAVTGAVIKYAPKIEHAFDEASLKLVHAIESAAPARDEVQRRSAAAVAALKGEVVAPEKKSGRWGRRFLVVGLLSGLGAAAFAFVKSRKEDDSWITSDTPYPTYGGATPPTSDTTTTAFGASTTVSAGATEEAIGGLGEPAEPFGQEPISLAGDTVDVGGASPDEAAADALDAPVAPSTPEEPAERITPKDVADHIHHRD